MKALHMCVKIFPGLGAVGLTSPSFKIIPDSELVYGPAAADFSINNITSFYNSYLLTYSDYNKNVQEVNEDNNVSANPLTVIGTTAAGSLIGGVFSGVAQAVGGIGSTVAEAVPPALDGSRDWLQTVVTNDLTKVGVGGAQYSLVLNEQGGIVDDVVHIGSSNFDYRSFYLNLEVMLRIEDRTFAEALRSYFERELKACKWITPDVHRRRATLWRRFKWAIAHFLVNVMDYTVTRRLNVRA